MKKGLLFLFLVLPLFANANISETSLDDGHGGVYSAVGTTLNISFTTSPPWTEYIRSRDNGFNELSGEIYCDWTTASSPNQASPCAFDMTDSAIVAVYPEDAYYYFIVPYSGPLSANFYIESTCGAGPEIVLASAGTSGCSVPPATPSPATSTATSTANVLNYQEQLVFGMIFLVFFSIPFWRFLFNNPLA